MSLKANIKNLILAFLSPLLRSKSIFKWCTRSKLFVFVFHDVSDKPSQFSIDCDLNTAPEVFKKQIHFIQKHFDLTSTTEVLENLKNNKKVQSRQALITFDDGYKSLFEFAFPYLEQNKIPATLFVNGEVFDGQPILSGLLTYLSKNEVSFNKFCASQKIVTNGQEFLQFTPDKLRLFKNGSALYEDQWKKALIYCGENLKLDDLKKFEKSNYISFGSHLFNHFSGLNLSEIELIDQIRLNRKYCSELTNGVNAISATYGQFTSSLGAKFIKSGIDLVFGHNNGPNSEYSKMLKRISLPTTLQTEKELISAINKTVLKSYFS